MGSWWKTITMLALLLLSLTVALTSPMHLKPPINQAVCDTPSFLISEETGWCYRPGSQGPCEAGEVFLSSATGNIGHCKPRCRNTLKLVHIGTGLCYRADKQGPCRPGELFVLSDLLGVGECKNMRQMIIPLFPFSHFYYAF